MKHLVLILALVWSLMASVNINKADKEELMSLKGIGEKKAAAIIDYRTKHGKFKSIDELTHVKGIGEKMVATIKKEVTLQ